MSGRVGRRALVLLALGLAACGYHAGLVVPEKAQGARTIGVEYFGNDTKVRDLEAPLAGLVARQLVDRVPLDLADPGRADLVVRGTLTRYDRRGGIRSTENVLLERGLRIELNAQLVERSSNQVLRSTTRGLWGGYVAGPVQNEREVRDRILDSLAEAVVLDLFGPEVP